MTRVMVNDGVMAQNTFENALHSEVAFFVLFKSLYKHAMLVFEIPQQTRSAFVFCL